MVPSAFGLRADLRVHLRMLLPSEFSIREKFESSELRWLLGKYSSRVVKLSVMTT